jgi:hypothetical protein
VHGLTNGRFDLAILFRHDLDSTLEVEPLMRPSSPYVLLPEGHPLAEQADVSLHQLVHEPMIHLDVQPSRTYFIKVFEEHGLSPNVVFSSPSLEMVRGMVGQGFGFSLLVTRPRENASYDGRRLVCRPLREQVSGSQLAATWLARSPLTKPARLFVEHCKEMLGQLDAAHALPPKVTDLSQVRQPPERGPPERHRTHKAGPPPSFFYGTGSFLLLGGATPLGHDPREPWCKETLLWTPHWTGMPAPCGSAT